MHFFITREALLSPLSLVTSAVERRQTMAILANVLLAVENDTLSITGTDLEIELIGHIKLDQPPKSAGKTTVSARKLATICKALPNGCTIEFLLDDQQLIIRAGTSQFTLAVLPPDKFPNTASDPDGQRIVLEQAQLKHMINLTRFAMAQQDVRYYLNGMLWEIQHNQLRLVATDGHRLAMSTIQTTIDDIHEPIQVILPYKGAHELTKLLVDDLPVELLIGNKCLRATTDHLSFTSKLLDGKFPNYNHVIPRNNQQVMSANRELLFQALSRVAILANEKYRSIRLALANHELTITANNTEQEQAEEKIAVAYEGEALEIGFNVNYLLDVVSTLSSDTIQCSFSDANGSVLLEDPQTSDNIYVIMPMKL